MEEEVKKEEAKVETEAAEEVKDTKDEEIAKLKAEVNDWKKEYSIKLADFENYKKRKDKELEEFKKYACEKLILKQLEAVDTLGMAIQSADQNKDIDSLIEGIKMIHDGMIRTLDSEGVQEINAKGEKYDPYLHQALLTENKEDVEDDIVVNVLQKGYKLKGKVIRPARVVINKK